MNNNTLKYVARALSVNVFKALGIISVINKNLRYMIKAVDATLELLLVESIALVTYTMGNCN